MKKEYKQILIDADLHAEFKSYLAAKKLSIKEVTQQLINKYLRGKSK